jgi:hypothetical protein
MRLKVFCSPRPYTGFTARCHEAPRGPINDSEDVQLQRQYRNYRNREYGDFSLLLQSFLHIILQLFSIMFNLIAAQAKAPLTIA